MLAERRPLGWRNEMKPLASTAAMSWLQYSCVLITTSHISPHNGHSSCRQLPGGGGAVMTHLLSSDTGSSQPAWCRYWEGRTLDTWCRPAQVTVVSGHSCRHLCMASVVTRSHLWASLVTTCGHLANVRTLGVAQCAMACVMCVQCVYYCVMLIMPSCAQHYLAHRW